MPYDLVKVDLRAKKLENGDDYLTINPKGQVPALALDSGEVVTEGPVIVQMIADKAADKYRARSRPCRSLQAAGLAHLYQQRTAQELRPQFRPVLPMCQGLLQGPVMGKFKYVDGELAGKDYLMGKQFRVADGYMFTMLSWAERMKLDLADLSEPDGLQGPRRRPPEGAGSADQGGLDEGGVSFSRRARTRRAGSMIRPFLLEQRRSVSTRG